jgi:D-psicose/D-tagatose/L-ribulose 3-epimerase
MIYCGWGYLTGKPRTEEEWKWGIENFRAIAEYGASTSSLVFGIEPVNRFESHFINVARDAVRFIDEIGMENVKVHLDTFHMIREEDNIRAAVLDAGSKLGYVHACESQRGIPGHGLMPWVEFFTSLREVGYDGCITIESFDPEMPSIAKLCCIWRKLAESQELLATEGLQFLRGVKADVDRVAELR